MMRRATPVLPAILLLASIVLASCSTPLPVSRFAQAGPALDPVAFFTGHVRSWGVLEDRSGQPTQIVTTDCEGAVDPDGVLRMTQRLHVGGDAATVREWRMRRTGPGRFEATANDMVGVAVGEAAGPAFHWHWTLATQPGNSLKNVVLDQWWYLQADGSMLNRTTIRKLGFIGAEVTEHFVPQR